MDILKELRKLKVGKIIEKPLMRNYTTYKVGGEALALIYPDSTNDLVKLINFIKENNIKYKILGNGSNVIFNDNGYNGLIIKLDKFDKFEKEDNKFIVGSGYPLIKFAYKVSRLGYTGMEFATGIPGTIGGAIYMNAGAYNSDMGYVVSEVKVLTENLEIKVLYNHDLDFHYRDSILQHIKNYICLEATIVLKKGKVDAIMSVIEDRKQRRLISQPLEYPSAGSVFRNPTGDYAGRLIESLGYKGKMFGGACVSSKHANFIINKDHAKGEEIKELITNIKKDVKDKYNIELKVEQEFVE